MRLGEGGGGALGLRRGQVLSQQGRHGVQYAVIGGFGTKHWALICGLMFGEGRKEEMPSVMDYEEVKTSFPRVFDFVSGANGTVVTIVRAGRPVARLSPISVYRTTEADPSLKGKVNCDLFADESADWESA